MEKKEMVNHPSHYNQNGIECFDVILAAIGKQGLRHFMIGNAIKYLFRAEYKGKYLEDLKKARFYIDEVLDIYSMYDNDTEGILRQGRSDATSTD